ncbi:PIN domain-containing protein [Candidatus Bathyarchaeota archaeon]|nr:PIN domain-containing protein [Candidatus Bathyarchaeota archaeon]
MVCLDTDFLVSLIRGDPEAVGKADELDMRGVKTTITPITAFELFMGAYRSEQREANLSQVLELVSGIPLLEYDVWAAEKAAKLASTLDSRGETIGIRDSMIAGITVRHGETLLTRNIRHFSRITELEIETW